MLPEWSDSIVAHGGWVDSSRAYAFPSGREVVLPMVSRRTGARLIERSWPEGWGVGGLLAPGGATADEARYVATDLERRARLSTVAVSDRACPGARAEPRLTYVVDLSRGFDEVWHRGFKKTARTAVRRAVKAGVEIRRGTDPAMVEAFASLYGKSAERWAVTRGQPRAVTRVLEWYRDRPGRVASAVAHMGGHCEVWLAVLDGAPVAASIDLWFGHWATAWMVGFDKEAMGGTQAMQLIEKTSLEVACARGVRWYDLGESDPGSLSEQAKRRIGGVPQEVSMLRVDRLPLRHVERLGRRLVNRA